MVGLLLLSAVVCFGFWFIWIVLGFWFTFTFGFVMLPLFDLLVVCFVLVDLLCGL